MWLFLGIALVAGPGPSCAGQPPKIMTGSGYDVVARCEENGDAIVLTLAVVRTKHAAPLGRALALSVEFEGKVENASAPTGWQVADRRATREGTTVIWRPLRRSGVRIAGRTDGFRVVLSGDNARVSCRRTMTFESGGFGGGC